MQLVLLVKASSSIDSCLLTWVGLLLEPQLSMSTMISLVIALVVSTKSRHIEIQHHYIRQLSARSVIRLEYVASAAMRANALTKVLPKAKFIQERDNMLNCCVCSFRSTWCFF